MSDQPLGHLQRRSVPWREASKTECGRGLPDVAKVITWHEAKAIVDKHGKQRAVFLLCMTCVETAQRYRHWETSPTDIVAREGTSRWASGEHSQMDRDLFAIAALIEAHREEFDGYLEDLAGTTSLAEHRRAKRASR